jgi:hypothetical protein
MSSTMNGAGWRASPGRLSANRCIERAQLHYARPCTLPARVPLSHKCYRELAAGPVKNSNSNQPLKPASRPRGSLTIVRIGTAATGALWLLSTLRTIVPRWQRFASSGHHKGESNEEISSNRYVLAGPSYCRLQHEPSASAGGNARASGTAGTGRPTWATGGAGAARTTGRDGPDRRSGTDRPVGPTRSGRTMSSWRASLYKPQYWNRELCPGLTAWPEISVPGSKPSKQYGQESTADRIAAVSAGVADSA